MSDLPASPGGQALGTAFTPESDLIPLFLLRFDRENTRRAYRGDLEAFFGSPAVPLGLTQSVSFTHVNEYVLRMESDGLSTATIRRRVASLRGFFAWLVALGLLPLNPADRQLVRRIASTDPGGQLMTVLTRDQASQLLDAVDLSKESGLRDRTLVSTLLHCVLRRSEAVAMDFEHIRQAGPWWVLHLPKAKGGSNQTVKIPESIVAQIDEVKKTYGYSSGPIWRSLSRNHSRGRRLSPTSVYMIVNRLARSTGINGSVGAHTMRHTGCTLAIEGGASIQQVQTHARHKNIETTMRYVHQRDRLANSAADFIHLDS